LKIQQSTAFFKAIQIKIDESDFQSFSKVLSHQKPFQILNQLYTNPILDRLLLQAL